MNKYNWSATNAPIWKKMLVFVYILPVFMAMEKHAKPSIIALLVQSVIAYCVCYLNPFLAIPFILWLSISSVLFFLENR